MTKDDFFELVAGVLNIPTEELALDSGPSSMSQWDSLAHVTICTAIEESFSIRFSMKDMLSIKTLSDLIDLMTKHDVSLG